MIMGGGGRVRLWGPVIRLLGRGDYGGGGSDYG